MQRILFIIVLSLAFVFPSWAQEAKKADNVQITGHVLVEKDKDGQSVVKVKSDDGTVIQLVGDKLPELLKIEKLSEKEFVFSGEKQPAKDGAPETFLLKDFFEVEADHTGHDHNTSKESDDHKGHNHAPGEKH